MLSFREGASLIILPTLNFFAGGAVSSFSVLRFRFSVAKKKVSYEYSFVIGECLPLGGGEAIAGTSSRDFSTWPFISGSVSAILAFVDFLAFTSDAFILAAAVLVLVFTVAPFTAVVFGTVFFATSVL